MRRTLLLPAILALSWGIASAEPLVDSAASPPPSHAALRLTIHDYGICLGNAPRVHGLRFNLSDRELERVDGLNVTFWAPRNCSRAVINGIALGLLAPAAGSINGLSLGGIATVGESSLRGISAATIATVSEGAIDGVSAAGLAVVGEKHIAGVSVAGTAVVSEGNITGVGAAGLATIAGGGSTGINAGGLAVISGGRAAGIIVGGLAVVTEGGVHGIAAGSLAVVSEGSMTGMTMSGIATVCEGNFLGIGLSGGVIICEKSLRGLAAGAVALPSRIQDGSAHWSLPGISAHDLLGLAIHGMNVQVTGKAEGITVSGIHLSAGTISGLSAAPWTRTGELRGIGAGLFNDVKRRQTGITIGVFNRAGVLRGVQIGLLNYAGNNPRGLKLLPGVNVHL